MGRGRRIAALAVPVTGFLVGIGLAFVSTDEALARREIVLDGEATAAQAVTVACRISTWDDSSWDGATGRICHQPTMVRLVVIGGLVTGAAVVGMVLASRPGSGPIGQELTDPVLRLTRAASSLVLVAGISATGVGLVFLLPLAEPDVVRLQVDEASVLRVLADDPDNEVLAAFEVVGRSPTELDLYEEELWIVVETASAGGVDLESVRRDLAELDWEPGEVDPEFSDGWVAFRGLTGEGAVDKVEVGLAVRARALESGISANARRLLETELPDDLDAVVVRVAPSPLAG
jgi:hypothetical protein